MESCKFKILMLIDYYNFKHFMNIKYLSFSKSDLLKGYLNIIFRLTIIKVRLIK